MSRTIIARYVTPWKFRREQQERRLTALRQRDGDNCSRCRRPVRFDLTPGHDLGPKVEEIVTQAEDAEESIDNLCLTHRRCNSAGLDSTAEVKERIRRKSEAALFTNSRARRRA
jgi:hypothetical protein